MSRKTTNHTASGTGARMRWNEQAAREVIDAVQASGTTVAQYARQHGLNAWVLYDWRRRLGMRRGSTPTASRRLADVQSTTRSAFLPVRVARPEASDASSSAPLELVLTSGRVVRVPSSFDGAALRRLVAALEEVG